MLTLDYNPKPNITQRYPQTLMANLDANTW